MKTIAIFVSIALATSAYSGEYCLDRNLHPSPKNEHFKVFPFPKDATGFQAYWSKDPLVFLHVENRPSDVCWGDCVLRKNDVFFISFEAGKPVFSRRSAFGVSTEYDLLIDFSDERFMKIDVKELSGVAVAEPRTLFVYSLGESACKPDSGFPINEVCKTYQVEVFSDADIEQQKYRPDIRNTKIWTDFTGSKCATSMHTKETGSSTGTRPP
jgi:hypothetical protein